MPSPSPIPAIVTGQLPDWLTGIVVPIAAAVVAALIVVAGLAIDARQRERVRRATFVDELTQLLMASAKAVHAYGEDAEDAAREGMAANVHRVQAVAQMRRREFPIYDFASRQAREVLNREGIRASGRDGAHFFLNG